MKISNQHQTPVSHSQRTAWFEQARFGMFIHFGLYSAPGGKWKGRKIKHAYSEWLQASEHIPRKEYRQLTKKFNPVNFDADAWIQEAKNAGMKYFIITSKHHDGFALWPTKASKYNVMDETPFKRDILGELAEACRKADIKFGLYYSHWLDWEGTGGDICEIHMKNAEYAHPSKEKFANYWRKKCLVQVRELIERYDPAILWFDSWHDYEGKGRDLTAQYVTPERQDELISLIRSLSDKCLINSRICNDHPSPCVDYISMGDNEILDMTKGPDPHNPASRMVFENPDHPWETNGTLNDSWAYHSLDFKWKPARQLIRNLINSASLGGNYALNVGPTGDGQFQPAAIRRLREIGAWLSVNGESIYGTGRSPLPKAPWGCITTRPLGGKRMKYYLHLWEFTPGTALFVEGIRAASLSAQMLENSLPVKAVASQDGVFVSTPVELHGSDLPVIVLDVVEK